MPAFDKIYRQHGKPRWLVLVLILLAAIAAAYYFYSRSTTEGYDYRAGQATELHGVVHWEHSNIPATRVVVALYQTSGNGEQLLSRLPVEKGYYRFSEIPAARPLFIRVYRQQEQGETLILQTVPRALRDGRAKYLPLYLPSARERQAGGFPDRVEGRIRISRGKVYLSPAEDFHIRLSGARLDELAALQGYLVGVKGYYRAREHFRVANYFILEGETADRPLLGELQQQNVAGKPRFVLVGEADSQLLLVPKNYRLRPVIERSLGALVMLSGPVEQGAVKPLTLTVVKP